MNSVVRFLLIFCVLTTTTTTTTAIATIYAHSDADAEHIAGPTTLSASVDSNEQDARQQSVLLDSEEAEGGREPARHLANSYEVSDDYAKQDHHAAFRRRAKPLKNIFMGIYKNYKSTYLGNKTSMEYKKKLRNHKNRENFLRNDTFVHTEVDLLKYTEVPPDQESTTIETTTEYSEVSESNSFRDITTETNLAFEYNVPEVTTELAKNEDTRSAALRRKQRKRKRKYRISNKTAKKQKRLKISAPAGGDDPLVNVHGNEYRYKVGAGVNMTLDMANDIVNVNLDGGNLQEIMRGRWLSDNSAEGRGKKYDMVTKVLPLFVLPFLIQSAIVPFLVTKLKLLLMKSILVGKLAIFLLIISAIRNNNKPLQSYEVAPSYWAGEPSRRSELAAAASSNAYNGYRVEGKPTAWIN